MKLAACFVVMCGLGAVSTAMAQNLDGSAEVVVTGKSRPTPARIEKANQFIKRAGVLRNGQQLARWVDPICVHVIGLDEQYSQVVNEVVRHVGAQAGVQVAPAECHPNIMISFTDDGAGLTQAIFKRSTRSLSEVSHNTKNQLLHGNAGVRWWYTTEVKGSDGRSLVSGPPVAAPTGGEGGASIIPDKPTLNTYSSSIVTIYGVRAITRATAIVDVHGATGLSLNTVAEYIALVVLAEVYPQVPPPENSVLDAFSGPASPKRLTSEDRAFLSALYKVSLDRQPSQQRGSMAVAFAERAN